MITRPAFFARAGAPVMIGLLLLGALSGCAAPAPSTGSDLGAGSTPSASASADPVVVPTPLIDLDCAALASNAQLASLSGSAVTLRPPGDVPYLYSFRMQQVGGLNCEWSNGKTDADSGPTERREVTMTVVADADAAAKWARYVETYATVPGSEYSFCSGSDGGPSRVHCEYDLRIDRVWLMVTVDGIAGGIASSDAQALTATRPVVDAAVAAVGSAGPGGAPFAVPAGTPAISRDCRDYLTTSDFAAALGIGGLIVTSSADGPQILPDIALDGTSPLVACQVSDRDSVVGPATMTIWPAGEWAFRALSAGSATMQEVTSGGSAAGRLWIDCPPGAVSCTADAVVHHNWIRLTLGPDTVDAAGTPQYSYAVATSTAVRTLGADLLAALVG